MPKVENHKTDLIELLNTYLATDDWSALAYYLEAHSNLPGPRGNLELAKAFSFAIQESAETGIEQLWRLCAEMTAITSAEAPVNDPKEFLPFSGTIGLGTIGALDSAFTEKALTRLRQLSRDPRWRMREGVCMALQTMLPGRAPSVLKELQRWIQEGHFLEMRAAAAAVAEPLPLKDKELAQAALQMHRDIMVKVLSANDRKSEDFKVLKKGLAYTLSVVVAAVPEDGFRFVTQLVDSGDDVVLWIVRQNMMKKRLANHFPSEVESIMKLLDR